MNICVYIHIHTVLYIYIYGTSVCTFNYLNHLRVIIKYYRVSVIKSYKFVLLRLALFMANGFSTTVSFPYIFVCVYSTFQSRLLIALLLARKNKYSFTKEYLYDCNESEHVDFETYLSF